MPSLEALSPGEPTVDAACGTDRRPRRCRRAAGRGRGLGGGCERARQGDRTTGRARPRRPAAPHRAGRGRLGPVRPVIILACGEDPDRASITFDGWEAGRPWVSWRAGRAGAMPRPGASWSSCARCSRCPVGGSRSADPTRLPLGVVRVGPWCGPRRAGTPGRARRTSRGMRSPSSSPRSRHGTPHSGSTMRDSVALDLKRQAAAAGYRLSPGVSRPRRTHHAAAGCLTPAHPRPGSAWATWSVTSSPAGAALGSSRGGSPSRRTRVARYRDDVYWGRPVPGFGDPAARVLLVGLAPAAHGGNRTGRVFTGDGPGVSGELLFRALHAPASHRVRDRSVRR